MLRILKPICVGLALAAIASCKPRYMSHLENDTGHKIWLVVSTKDNPRYGFGEIPVGSGLNLEIEMPTFWARYEYAGKHCFLSSGELLHRSVLKEHGERFISLKPC
jgi:hypothetical protein